MNTTPPIEEVSLVPYRREPHDSIFAGPLLLVDKTSDGVNETTTDDGNTVLTCVTACTRPVKYKVNRWFHYNVYVPFRLFMIQRRLAQIDKMTTWYHKRAERVSAALFDCLERNGEPSHTTVGQVVYYPCIMCEDYDEASKQAYDDILYHFEDTIDEAERLEREAFDLKGMLAVYHGGSFTEYHKELVR